MSVKMRTLLDIIKATLAGSGHKGPLTRKVIDQWHRAHPEYGGGKWKLWALFGSGSAMPTLGKTKLTRATEAWMRAGNPQPGPEGVDVMFDDFLGKYVDEYSDGFYDAPKPAKSPIPERAVKKPKR